MCRPRACAGHGPLAIRLRGAAEEPIASVHGDKVPACRPSTPTVASLLRDAAYATALIGKWHLGYPPHFGPRQPATKSSTVFMPAAMITLPTATRAARPDFWLNEEPHEEDGYRPIC